MRNILAAIITLYQRTLSPDHGPLRVRYPYGFCRFYPSCSEYAKQAILQKGVLKGVLLASIRIVKCNPFSRPRVDTVN